MNSLPPRPSSVIVPCEQADAWIDGYAFLDAARRRADELDSETQKTLDAARTEGYEAGRRAAEAEAVALVADATQQMQRYYGGLDERLAELTLQTVRRVLSDFDDTTLVARCAANALRELRDDMAVIIRVSPNRLTGVEAALERVNAEQPARVERVEADPGLADTQCLFVSPLAVIDVGLDAQLNSLRHALSALSQGVS